MVKNFGLNEKDIQTLKIGGLFHDIGKIGVPDSILLKQGKLSDEEYQEIKKHPSIGANILSTATIFEDIIPIVKHHHERFDGKGYPSNLKGDQIPYLARIAAIADAYDAMTSKRPYREPLDINIVKNEINKNLGIQFDPEIGRVFLEILNTQYNSITKEAEKMY